LSLRQHSSFSNDASFVKRSSLNPINKNLNWLLFNQVRCGDGCFDLVQYLISRRVDVNRENIYGRTALSYSLSLKDDQVFKLLLSLREKSRDQMVSFENSLLIKTAFNGKFKFFAVIHCKLIINISSN
jgi:ankyrin repeat protein